jgi:superfamily II DNA helicase RecQ
LISLDRIEREIKLASIGEFGENNVAFELKNSGIPMYILRDVHLEIDDLSAQIDFVVVTRKVIFIVECKNLIGNIDIDSEGNFIRNYTINGRNIKAGIYSPITQNQRHLEVIRQIKGDSKNIVYKAIFDKFFDENYKSIVVLANPKTILNARYAKKEIKDKVIRADQLNRYIKETCEKSNSAAFNDKDMKAFAEGILALHSSRKSDYAKKYIEIIDSMSEEKSETEEIAVCDSSYNQDGLINSLKAFRLKKSKEENIKSYFIFNDKQMMDLISKMPDSKEELQGVCGFGPVKSEKYGDTILEILRGKE